MKKKIIWLILALLSFSTIAEGSWGLGYNIYGFMGNQALLGSYRFNERHRINFGVGVYKILNTTYSQIDLGYDYQPFHIRFNEFNWAPIEIGLYALRTLDSNRYFIKSPDEYPTADYYDQTRLRIAAKLGTAISLLDHDNLVLDIYAMLLDLGFIARYNNIGSRLQYYTSGGASLSYYFE